MYLLDKGYWRPDIGEIVKIAEEPHVIKLSGTKDGKSVRMISIPNPYRETSRL